MNSSSLDQPDLPEGTYRAASQETLLDFDLSRAFEVVRRNRWWILLIVLAAVLTGLAISLLATPRYVATSKVLIEQQADQIIEGSDLDGISDPYDAERFLNTQIDIIRSRSLAERVVREERLFDDKRFFAAFGAERPLGSVEEMREVAADLLQMALTTELPFESRVVPINVTSQDAVLSARLANAYATHYIESNLTRKFDSSTYAREFLSNELEQARERLETSERDLNQYSRAAGLIRVTGQSEVGGSDATLSVTNDSLRQANSAASDATAERVAAQDRWETISDEPALAMTEVLENPAVQELIKQKSQVAAELAEERARHLDTHPRVKQLVARSREIDQRIDSIGRSIKRSVYLEYEAAQARENALEARVGALRSDALNEQDSGVQYNVLKRVADTNRALYDTLLERYNELNASAGAASNNIALVDAAEVPGLPASPNIPLNLLLSAFIGVALAGGFVLLREHFDDVIRSPEDVEARIGLPILGIIPLVEDHAVENELRDSKSAMSEAYHTLVTNLLYSTSTGLPRSILVTSADERQGKTTTANALALDLARLGRSVLLVDADLRRPTLHRMIEAGDRHGLTAMLAGQTDMHSALIPGPVANLTYLTALPIPPEPSLLLGGERLPELIGQFKKRFDVVVVDSPPMLGLSDAALLASHLDGVIIMADAGRFHRGALKATVRRLRMVNATVLGVVVTKFDPRKAGGDNSYYGHGYYRYESSGDD